MSNGNFVFQNYQKQIYGKEINFQKESDEEGIVSLDVRVPERE